MREIEDFTDERLKSTCIHCGRAIAEIESNRDHVPTKSLLTKALRARGAEYDRGAGDDLGYLPQVLVCRTCNSGFSNDETYLLCVLHAVMASSLRPDPTRHPEAANVLRSNRRVVRALETGPDGQLFLFDDLPPFALYPDPDPIARIVVKNARGHAYHDLGEPIYGRPDAVEFVPLQIMDHERREAFERAGAPGDLAVWPEVGSRMTVNLLDTDAMIAGWIVVEPGRYRYCVDWSNGVTVKKVVWEYLATMTRWSA